MMKRKKTQSKFLEAFSPTIMESTVPKRFVDIVNDTGDAVLSDKQKSVQWDWSHKLVGKVSKEVQIPVSNSDDRDFLFKVMRQACLDYLKHIISKNRSYKWSEMAGDGVPTLDNIHLTHSWIVSQYAGEYNPYHHHSGDFSAVIYLKIPPKMQEELDKELEDHFC